MNVPLFRLNRKDTPRLSQSLPRRSASSFVMICPLYSPRNVSLFISSPAYIPIPLTWDALLIAVIQASLEDRGKTSVWSEAQSQMLQAAGFVLRDNPRVSCLIACMINKHCYEVWDSPRDWKTFLTILVDRRRTASYPGCRKSYIS